jgi:hypothetical protein
MNKQAGWKPMPTILKIIWVITAIGVPLSFTIFSEVYTEGSDIFGMKVQGLTAVNVHFFLMIFFPAMLLIGMMKRNRHVWILGVLLHVVPALNTLFIFSDFSNKKMELIESFQAGFSTLAEADLSGDFYTGFVIALVVNVVAINMIFAAIFYAKRMYFQHVPAGGELPPDSDDQ